MSLIVQKFGGTSVGSPERIHAVADRIQRARADGNSLVVVVSAMGHTTDELIDLAHRVSKQPPHREMDMLLTAGERISMALLSMALVDRGVDAISFTGSQSGIITDASHRCARIRRILGDRVRAAVSAGKVAIVAGFQGVSETKEITTLGRGGSDTTAVALAAALKADRCEIFTDVDGVYSADPRFVKEAKLWKRLPHDLMVELATRGAGVLHPRSVELAKQFGVPVCVKNSLNNNEGTELVPMTKQEHGMEEFRVIGVTTDKGKALVTVKLMRPGSVGALWGKASEGHLLMVSPVFSENEAKFFADKDSESDWRKALQQLATDGFVKSFEFDPSFVPVSVVGDRFSQDGAALFSIMESLVAEGVQVPLGASSALAVTVAVPVHKANDIVQQLHQRFFE